LSQALICSAGLRSCAASLRAVWSVGRADAAAAPGRCELLVFAVRRTLQGCARARARIALISMSWW
jgi:hypothetical protein